MQNSQTKWNVYLITELLAFGLTLTSNFNLLPNMLPLPFRFLLKRPMVKTKYKFVLFYGMHVLMMEIIRSMVFHFGMYVWPRKSMQEYLLDVDGIRTYGE